MKLLAPVQVAFALVVLNHDAGAQTSFHEALSLDTPSSGDNPWLFTPLVSTPVSSPGPIAVPSFWSEDNPDWDNDWPADNPKNKEIKKAKYTRNFTLPSTMAAKKIKIRFEAVNYTCEVRIDGQLVGPKHFQPFAPFEYYITPFVTPDGVTQHALEVTVEDHEDPDFLVYDSVQAREEYDYPMGTPVWAYQGNGICGPVTVVAAPSMRIEDVYVRTFVSPDPDQISLHATIVNDQAVAHRITLTHEVYEILSHDPEVLASSPSLTVSSPPPFVTIPGASTTEVDVSAPWSTAKLWSPGSPTLYRVKSKLTEGGVTKDEAALARFGFREFSVEGNRYSLNGIPFHGWGDSTHLVGYNAWNDRDMIEYLIDAYKSYGVRLLRHGAAAPPLPVFYDVCDEKGMLCYAEMNWNGQNSNHTVAPYTAYAHNYEAASFEQHADEMITALVKRDRNHPSIVIWSLANETFYGDPPGYPSYSSYRLTLADRADLIAQLDPTRPVGCDSDGSLGTGSNPSGTHELAIKNKHYPSTLAHIDNNGKDHGLTESFNPDPSWVLGIAVPDIPLGVGEWMFNEDPESAQDHAEHPANWGDLRGLTLRFYRLAGLSDIRPFVLAHDNLTRNWDGQSPRRSHMTMRQSMSPVAVFDFDYDARGVQQASDPPLDEPPVYNEGVVADRNYAVLNDDLSLLDPDPAAAVNETITIDWAVSRFGRVTSSGSTSTTLPLGEALGDPSEDDFLALQWATPAVDADGTPFVLSLTARKQNNVRYNGYYVFLAEDLNGSITNGIDPATKKGTFVATFDDEVNYGWRYHDRTWTVSGGELHQPETGGLLPNNKTWYDQAQDARVLPSSKFGLNSKIASLEPYKYADLRMSCDVTLLDVDVPDQGAGIGVRLQYGESGAWFESDATRRNGYYLMVTKGASGYALLLLKCWPSAPWITTLDWDTLPQAADGQSVRLELEARGSTLTASAACTAWTSTVPLQGSDAAYSGERFVNLIMQEGVAAKYDNVQVGSAPYAPQLAALPAQIALSSPLLVSWTQELDWEQSAVNVQYKLNWTTAGGSGATQWSQDTSYTVPGGTLELGPVTFVVRSRDNHGQISAPSQARVVVVVR